MLVLTGLKALGVSTLGLSIDTSSVGEEDVLGEEHSVSFFSGLTREGVEFRTDIITEASVEAFCGGVDGGVSHEVGLVFTTFTGVL